MTSRHLSFAYALLATYQPGLCLYLTFCTMFWYLIIPALMVWTASIFKEGIGMLWKVPLALLVLVLLIRRLADVADAADWRVMLVVNLLLWYFGPTMIAKTKLATKKRKRAIRKQERREARGR